MKPPPAAAVAPIRGILCLPIWTLLLTFFFFFCCLPYVTANASLPPGATATTSPSTSSAKSPTQTAYSGPKISITAHDGSFVSPNGPSPIISWKTSGIIPGRTDGHGVGRGRTYEYDLGLDVQVKTVSDFNALPKTVWGRIATKLGVGVGSDDDGDDDGEEAGGDIFRPRGVARLGVWDVSARADVDVRSLPEVRNVDLDLRADCDDIDLSVKVFGTAGQSQQVSLRRIDVSKGFQAPRGTITINPRWDVPSSSGDVVLTYDRSDEDDTVVQVHATPHNQRLTIARTVAEGHVIAPTISSHGGFSVQWRHSYDGDKTVVTTLVPKENVNVRWTDGGWTCDIDAPIEGTRIDGMKVSVRRKMEFH